MKAQFAENLFDYNKTTYPNEDSAETYRKDLSPGTIEFIYSGEGDKIIMNYVCPCGCGRVRALTARTGEKIPNHWQWNGNKEIPTLQPSIACTQGCKWHGFLTNGEWITV